MKRIFFITYLIISSCSSQQTDASNTSVQKKEEITSEKNTVEFEGIEVTSINFGRLTYNNGDPIPVANSPEEWKKHSDNFEGCAAYVNFDPTSPLGLVYNGFVVTDKRGIAPEGFHIPSIEEWRKMFGPLETKENGQEALKTKNHWKTPGNNSSGFGALPTGEFAGTWSAIGTGTNFWSTTPTNPEMDSIYLYHYDIYNTHISDWYDHSMYGFAIRFVKD